MRSHLALAALAVVLAAALVPAACARQGAGSYLNKPEEWFRGEEGARVVANILSHQSPLGSWPKNLDTTSRRYTGDPQELRGTFDNGATVYELRFLARAYGATREPRHRTAFLKGLDHILEAQYPTGGWPQTYPPGPCYERRNGYAWLRGWAASLLAQEYPAWKARWRS